MRPFATPTDAARKLNGTLVTYDGDVYVCYPVASPISGAHDGMMRLCSLKDPNRMINKNYTDNAFQVVPYELGYANNLKTLRPVYISRISGRHSDVGIITSRLTFNYPGDNVDSPRNFPASSLYTDTFRDMLFNKYPSFDDALTLALKAKSENHGVAFAKNHALCTRFDDEDDLQVYLYVALNRVARYSREKGKFITMSKNKQFMLNMLAKSGVFSSDLIAS